MTFNQTKLLNRKLKILFVSCEYAHVKSPNYGGIGVFIANIGKNLVREGHEVYVIGYSNKRCFFKDEGVNVFMHKSLISWGFFIFRLFQWFVHRIGKTKWLIPILAYDKKRLAKNVSQIIRDKNIEIIESSDYLGETAYIESAIPLVIRCHGSYQLLSSNFGFRKNEAFVFFEKKAIAKADFIIGVSKFSALAIKKAFGLQKMPLVIYNGVDTSHFKPVNTSGKIHYGIFYHGSISKPKGLDILVEVFNQVIKLFPKAQLHIVGKNDSGYLRVLKNSLSKQAKQAFTYHGELSQKLLPNLLEKAHLFVFPSRVENFSLSWLEAMAIKKPVIVSNIPISSEIIQNGKNGFICNSIKEYVDAIIGLFNNDELTKKIGQSGYETTCNHYSYFDMVQKSIECYKKLLYKTYINK